MGFDRSKYKPASISDMQKQQTEQEQVRPTGGFNNEAHEIKPGANWFRIAPYHPEGGGNSPFEAKCVTFLDVKQPKKDSDKKIIEGQFEVRAKPIFNSRVHGGYEFDIVEHYMKIAKEIAIPNFTKDKEITKRIWTKITGFDPVKKKSGIKPIDTWEAYAWDVNGKLGTLSIKKTVKDALTQLAATSSTGNDPNTPDPFSDPEYGIAIVITKTGVNLDTKYTVAFDEKKINDGKGKITSVTEPTPLTDAQLQSLDKAKSLHERFVNSFKHKDLDYQLEGLENFDNFLKSEGYNIGVFQYSEFLDVVEKMFAAVPDDVEEAPEGEEVQEEIPTPKSVTRKPAQPVSQVATQKPVVARRAPVIQQQVEEVQEEEEQQAEEEVQEEIIPVRTGKKSVTATTVVEEGPKGPHIDAVSDKLALLKAKMGKKV